MIILICFIGALCYASCIAYPEDYYGTSPRTYGDDGFFLSMPDDSDGGYRYPDEVRYFNKRSYPRWYHASVFKEPIFRTSAIAETKRFLPPFHPLARFRGMAMGGSSGGGGIIAAPYRYRENFNTFIPSPSHPVPSDPKTKAMSHYLNEDDGGDNNLQDEQDTGPVEDDEANEKLKAGEILRFLTSTQQDRGLNGRARLFRFGIK